MSRLGVEHEDLTAPCADDLQTSVAVEIGNIEGSLRAVRDEGPLAAPGLAELPENLPIRVRRGEREVVPLFLIPLASPRSDIENERVEEARRLEPEDIRRAVTVEVNAERDTTERRERNLGGHPERDGCPLTDVTE